LKKKLKIYSNYKEKYDEQCRKNNVILELEQYRDLYYSLQETTKSLEDERNAYKIQQDRLQNKCNKFEMEIEMSKSSLQKAETRILGLEDSKYKEEKRYSELQKKLDEVESEKRIKMNEIDLEFNESKNKVQRVTRECEYYKDQNDILEKRLNTKESDCISENEKRLKLELKFKEMELEKTSMETELKNLTKIKENLEEMITDFHKTQQNNQKNNENRENLSLKSTNDILKQENLS